jgi:hypothetical protein
MKDFAAPTPLLDEGWQRVGIGVRQDAEMDPPIIRLVILAAR